MNSNLKELNETSLNDLQSKQTNKIKNPLQDSLLLNKHEMNDISNKTDTPFFLDIIDHGHGNL